MGWRVWTRAPSFISTAENWCETFAPFWWLPLGEAVERSETDEGKGLSTSSVSPHPSWPTAMPPSPQGKAMGIAGNGATPRHLPTQAAKKLRIGPQLIPVPPAESPVDGAGAGRGRKDGPPDSYLGPLNPPRSPFFFGFQKPFFFQQGSETGFDRLHRPFT